MHLPINGEIAPGQVEIFDSTTVSLFTDVYKNCGRLPENGQRKGGIKAFTKITLSERVPNFVCMKAASTNEKLFLSEIDLPNGTIAFFDKGFQKFAQYKQWDQSGVYYVTRLNNNATFKVVNQRYLEYSCEEGLQMDADIELSYRCPQSKKEETVATRMVAYIDPVSGKRLVFITNMLNVKAMTVCMLYKNRWTIEPLFKQIKQNFELTYFLSDSPEGIKTQIWVAMILNLIFTVIHKMVREAEDFSTMIRVAAKNAGSYVSLIKFLKNQTQTFKELTQAIGKVQLEIFPQNKEGTFISSA